MRIKLIGCIFDLPLKKTTTMTHTLFLFPIASILIIGMWFFYETKTYFKFKKWLSKGSTRIWDFFTNICERVNSENELY